MLLFSLVMSVAVVGIAFLVQYEHDSDPILAQQVLLVDAHVAHAFNQITSPDTFPVLFPFCEAMEPVDDKPWGVGKVFNMVQSFPFYGLLSSSVQVDAYKVEKTLDMSSSDNIFRPVFSMVLQEESIESPTAAKPDQKKKMTYMDIKISTKRRSLLVQWIFRPIFHYPIQSHLKLRLFALKNLFESL